jgi:hypothetical protein
MATRPLTMATALLMSIALGGTRPIDLGASSPATRENVPASLGAAVYREITIPAGTMLPLALDSYVASDQSRLEDTVRAHVRRNVVVNDRVVIPAGSSLTGYVTSVERSGRVKGRARLAFRFTRLFVPGTEPLRINTSVVARQAPATKGKDATTIGLPAAGGAIIGAVTGGKKGAAIGAAAGGGAGTAVVLSTRGREVRLGRGALVGVTLLAPITVRRPVSGE